MSRKQIVLQLAVLLMLVVAATTAIATVDTTQRVAADTRTEAAMCAICGDGKCAPRCENATTCPQDCAPSTSVAAPKVEEKTAVAACGKCGDGQCVRQCGETATSCPVDCGGTPVPSAAPKSE